MRVEKRENMSPSLPISDSMVWACSSRRREACSRRSICCCCFWCSWSWRREFVTEVGSQTVGCWGRRDRRPLPKVDEPPAPLLLGGVGVPSVVPSVGPSVGPSVVPSVAPSPLLSPVALSALSAVLCEEVARGLRVALKRGVSRRTLAAAARPEPESRANLSRRRRWSLRVFCRRAAHCCIALVRSFSRARSVRAIWRSKSRRWGPAAPSPPADDDKSPTARSIHRQSTSTVSMTRSKPSWASPRNVARASSCERTASISRSFTITASA
mmetsp:Transcript_13721/g.44765  ORF Transcript_13721/g.44765 Transcript_13721/m.44765 type:complete len:269 (-) Transcript_13721:200-1006(-)